MLDWLPCVLLILMCLLLMVVVFALHRRVELREVRRFEHLPRADDGEFLRSVYRSLDVIIGNDKNVALHTN